MAFHCSAELAGGIGLLVAICVLAIVIIIAISYESALKNRRDD